jgi:hypothetical protein
VTSEELQDQLQTEHSVDTGNYIMDRNNIESKTNYRQVLEEKYTNAENKKINQVIIIIIIIH